MFFKRLIKGIADSTIAFCLRNNLLKPMKAFPKGYNHILDIVIKEKRSGGYVVFDVGANIGQSIDFYRRYLYRPRITSFEAIPETFKALSSRVEKYGDVVLNNYALGERDAEFDVQISEESLNNSVKPSVFESFSTKRFERIKMMRLDDYCRKKQIDRIDVLKIDTEGYDLEVLRGSERLLSNASIKYIYCEVGFNNENSKVNLDLVISYLKSFDYKFAGLYEVNSIAKNELEVYYSNALFVSTKKREPQE